MHWAHAVSLNKPRKQSMACKFLDSFQNDPRDSTFTTEPSSFYLTTPCSQLKPILSILFDGIYALQQTQFSKLPLLTQVLTKIQVFRTAQLPEKREGLWQGVSFNPLKPNDPYSGRTAPLTSKRCILYISSTNMGTEYFKHDIYSQFFPLQNADCFINLKYLVPVLFTFCIHILSKRYFYAVDCTDSAFSVNNVSEPFSHSRFSENVMNFQSTYEMVHISSTYMVDENI